MVVRHSDGGLSVESGPPQTLSRSSAQLTTPDQVEPRLRRDGLVAERPDDWQIEYGDPFLVNYSWVAALDPVELSHHVDVTDARSEPLRGRPTWWARLRPQPGYEPRCSCCALLWSTVSDAIERDERGEPDEVDAKATFPVDYLAALDVQTGVVVSLRSGDETEGLFTFEIVIHEVDGPVAPVDEAFDPRYSGRVRRPRSSSSPSSGTKTTAT